MGIVTEEPNIQKKRKFDNSNQFNLNKQSSNPTQDDYFLIGPSDEKFAPSIAYRNKLKNQRPRSTSPIIKLNKSVMCKPKLMKKETNQNLRKFIQTKSLNDEAIQTDPPRKILEAEINHIRTEIEKKKQEFNKAETNFYEKQAKSNPPQKDIQHVKLNFNKSKEMETSLTDNTINAPRQNKQARSQLKLYAQQSIKEQSKHADNIISTTHPRLTEYQYAFRAPQSNSILDRSFVNQKKTKTCKTNQYISTLCSYDTEYRHKYKPFKYVPVEQMKTTSIQDHSNVNIIPIKRPISALGIRDITDKQNKLRRTLTPPSRTENKQTQNFSNKHKKYISEYNAKYRNYSANLYRPSMDQSNSENVPTIDWKAELNYLREKAEFYRQRDRTSHFSRNHLAQIGSEYVDYWDSCSTDRYEENYEKYKKLLRMPRAGKPSMNYEDKSGAANLYKRIMLDSSNIAQILDQNEYTDTEDEPKFASIHNNPTFMRSAHPLRERHAGIIPLDTISNKDHLYYSDNSRNLSKVESDPIEVTSLDDNATQSWNDNDLKFSDRNEKQNQLIHNKSIINPINCEIECTSNYSSLSTRSMNSSANLASRTLEHARQQRERILRENYHTNYTPNLYTQPNTYSSPLNNFSNQIGYEQTVYA